MVTYRTGFVHPCITQAWPFQCGGAPGRSAHFWNRVMPQHQAQVSRWHFRAGHRSFRSPSKCQFPSFQSTVDRVVRRSASLCVPDWANRLPEVHYSNRVNITSRRLAARRTQVHGAVVRNILVLQTFNSRILFWFKNNQTFVTKRCAARKLSSWLCSQINTVLVTVPALQSKLHTWHPDGLSQC